LFACSLIKAIFCCSELPVGGVASDATISEVDDELEYNLPKIRLFLLLLFIELDVINEAIKLLLLLLLLVVVVVAGTGV